MLEILLNKVCVNFLFLSVYICLLSTDFITLNIYLIAFCTGPMFKNYPKIVILSPDRGKFLNRETFSTGKFGPKRGLCYTVQGFAEIMIPIALLKELGGCESVTINKVTYL